MADKVVIELTMDELETVTCALTVIADRSYERGNRAEAYKVWALRDKLLNAELTKSCIETLEAYQREIDRYAERFSERARFLNKLREQFQSGKEE